MCRHTPYTDLSIYTFLKSFTNTSYTVKNLLVNKLVNRDKYL